MYIILFAMLVSVMNAIKSDQITSVLFLRQKQCQTTFNNKKSNNTFRLKPQAESLLFAAVLLFAAAYTNRGGRPGLPNWGFKQNI